MPSSMPPGASSKSIIDILSEACAPKAGQGGRAEAELSQVTFVPLFLGEEVDGRRRLSIASGGTLVGIENAIRISAGVYALHVFDTAGEARAAVSVMNSFGGAFAAEAGSLAGGEGVVLLRSHSVQSADINFVGAGGMVSIIISDGRRANSSNRPVALSTEWARQVALRYVGGNMRVDIDNYARARTLANIIGESTANATCLTLCQTFIERIPGARITIEGISTEEVTEAAEDLLADMPDGADLPTVRVMHSMIRRVLAGFRSNLAEEVSYKVASDILTRQMI